MTGVDEYPEPSVDPSDSVPDSNDCFDEFSHHHWQNKTAAVTDEFIKLKFHLETLQRDKERDAVLISSLKHVIIRRLTSNNRRMSLHIAALFFFRHLSYM